MKTRIYRNPTQINYDSIHDFFESRAQCYCEEKFLTTTMYQDNNPDLAVERDRWEKATILPLLEIDYSSNVLDVGCGIGRWTQPALDSGAYYTGVDFSESLIRIAKNRFLGVDNCVFIQSAAQNISEKLRERIFTHVIVSGVLIYMNDNEVKNTWEIISKLLVAGGLIYLREPVSSIERLTLKEHWSDELNSCYSSIYRTEEELLKLFRESCLSVSNLRLIQSGFLYGDMLNNRVETKQKYFIFRNT